MEESLPKTTTDIKRLKRIFQKKTQKIQSKFSIFRKKKSDSDLDASDSDSHKKSKKRQFLPKTWHKIAFGLACFLILLLTALLTFTFFQGRKLYQQVKNNQSLIQETAFLASSQNLPALPEKLDQLENLVFDLEKDYQGLKLYNSIPFAKKYYQDGLVLIEISKEGLAAGKIGLEALLPYSDLLGFSGEGSFTGGTTQDRIVLILQTIEEIQPTIDDLEQRLQGIEALAEKINPQDYPEKIAGNELRSEIIKAQESLSSGVKTFSDYKPVLGQLSKMAGADEAQKYLVLFQNDNELRPTGGFLTAYSIIKMDKGTVVPEKSDDIYELDQKFYERIPIPEKLGKYLTTERYWHLRDMNIAPDFKESMETFYEYYQNVPGEPDDVDGIIAVDTSLLTELLKVIGPVNIPGYGTFSAEIDQRCDCPQVVYALSEIITKPTPYLREDRKGILGPLMKAILSKTYELDKAKFPELFEVLLGSLKGRHLQMYFVDSDTQLAAEKINAAGRLYNLENNGADFLAIVDANLGGAKSNLFTQYELEQVVSAPENGFITKTLEITYKNTAAADNCNLEAGELCLNSTLNDWLRIYVPLGSELIEIQGIENEAEVYEEGGLTVFDGYFKLEPLGLAKIIVNYKVPYTLENYQLKMWKQGGIETIPVLIDVTGGQEELLLDQDLEYSTIF